MITTDGVERMTEKNENNDVVDGKNIFYIHRTFDGDNSGGDMKNKMVVSVKCNGKGLFLPKLVFPFKWKSQADKNSEYCVITSFYKHMFY